MQQPNEDLPRAMEQLSVSADDSNKTSPTLSDLPVDVFGPILEKLDYKQQLRLRRVSKSLRTLVDEQAPACKMMKVVCYTHSVDLTFNDYFVIYTKNKYEDDGDSRIISDNFKRIAFDDLAFTLKNPKLQLDELVVIYMFNEQKEFDEYCDGIRNMLGSLKLSVRVIKTNCFSSKCILSILPYLKPRFLEKISHYVDGRMPDSSEMDQVACLEQWKQAEELKMSNAFDEFPLNYATHFKRFEINESHLDENKFIRIRDFLSKLHHFEKCTLSCFGFLFNPALVSQVLGAPVSSNATEEVFHHPITDSNNYLQCTKPIKGYDVEIVKKKREKN